MADFRIRQIKVKTGIIKCLVKEKVMYEKEAKQQEEKIEKMKAEDGDNYAIKKADRDLSWKKLYKEVQSVLGLIKFEA
uniref:Tubulin-specific chaperone A n=1 Tax=Pseudonaja textilis TaxID=8673 RepID=A0A670Z563_PSETE